MEREIILASASPRRSQLLELAEIEFSVVVAHTDENYPDNLSPHQIAEFIAHSKAMAVVPVLIPNEEGYTIIAADTIVVLDNQILGKPSDRENAIQMLGALSGKTHQVITGVCLLSGNEMQVFSEITEVVFHPLSKKQIEFYVDKCEPYDKAGAYAIQEWIGVIGIKSIKGDFYNVMGLPVSRVAEALRQFQA